MEINLYSEHDVDNTLKAGDVLVYYNSEYDDYDYFMIVGMSGMKHSFRLLRLKDGVLSNEYFDWAAKLINHIQQPINGYYLHEIIPSEELELRRTNQ